MEGSVASNRARRDTNRINLSVEECGQTFVRRFSELFFDKGGKAQGRLSVDGLTLELVHVDPNIYVIDDFLSNKEVEDLLEEANQREFQQSFVDAQDGSTTADEDSRTSKFIYFARTENSVVRKIENKALKLMGGAHSVEKVEPLQMVKYEEGKHGLVVKLAWNHLTHIMWSRPVLCRSS